MPKEQRPAVPKQVALQLRKEAGFGCCKCGHPIFVYHHIVEYADDPHFRPEDMMILCPNCHEETKQGAMLEPEQRRHKAKPYNIQRGLAAGCLKLNQTTCAVELGNVCLIAAGDLIRVDGEPLLALAVNDEGALELSLKLYDSDDNLLASIDKNEWISDSTPLPWDLEARFSFLKIRRKKGDILLEIDARTEPIEIRADLWRKRQNFRIEPKALFFTTAGWKFSNLILQNACFEMDSTTGALSMRAIQEGQQAMPILLLHKGVVFEDAVVFLAGNAYVGCTFRRCTLIAREAVCLLENCKFEGVVWQLDMSVHDYQIWEAFVKNMVPVIQGSLPRPEETGERVAHT